MTSPIDTFCFVDNPDRFLEIHADQCIQSMCLCSVTDHAISDPDYSAVKILIQSNYGKWKKGKKTLFLVQSIYKKPSTPIGKTEIIQNKSVRWASVLRILFGPIFSNIFYNKINNAFIQCPYLYFNKQTKKLGGSLRKIQLRQTEYNTTSLETNYISIFIYIYTYIDVCIYIQVFVFRQKHVITTDIQ